MTTTQSGLLHDVAQAATVLLSGQSEQKRALVSTVRETVPSVVFQPDVDDLMTRLAALAA